MSITELIQEEEVTDSEKIYSVVLGQVIRIFNTFSQEESEKYGTEISALELPTDVYLQPSHNAELKSTYDIIKNNREITKQSFNSFILSSYCVSNENYKAYLNAQGRMILAAHYLSRKEGFTDTIYRACNSYRILNITPKYLDFLRQLPSTFFVSDELIAELKNVYGAQSSQIKHISNISILLKYYETQAKSARKPKRRDFNASTVNRKNYQRSEYPIILDEDEIIADERLSTPLAAYDINMEMEERMADQKSVIRYVSFDLIAPNEIKQSLALQNQQATSALNNMLRREKQLVCDFSQLTNHDLRSLIEYCFSSATENFACTYLLLSLLIGQNIEFVQNNITSLRVKDSRQFGEQPVWFKRPKLPKHVVDTDIEELLNRSEGGVILFLPKQLHACFRNIKNDNISIDSIKQRATEVIHQINDTKQTRLTLSRVANFLSYYLNHKGIDSTERALLLGKGTKFEPGVSYYQISSGKLFSIHIDYVKSVLQLANRSLLNVIDTSKSETSVGSQLQLKPEKLSKMVTSLRNRLASLRCRRWSDLEKFHNFYTIYVLNLLNLCTGHRPVRHPYERLTNFDLEAGLIYISDKEVRSTFASRVVVLPHIAVEQVKLYEQHLEIILPHINNSNADSGDYVAKALSSERPLFFFLSKSELSVEPVTPAALANHNDDILPLPLNWHRHFMRSWLRKLDLSGFIIDAWMGHISSAGNPLEQFSEISMADLRTLAKTIDCFLTQRIKLLPEAPWGGG